MPKKNTADQIVRAVRRIEDRSNIRAYVILRDGAHVGTVRIQFPRDGAGKLHACAADWTLDMPEGVDFTPPSVHLRKRLALQRAR